MRLRLTCVVLAAAGVLLGLPVLAGAATIEVGPGQSIQAAVDAASPGDTILVKAGTYKETVVVTKSDLTIQGQDAVLGAPTEAPPPGPCSDPEKPSAVDGFCVSGVIDPTTFTVTTYVENVTITGFQVSGFTGSGIIAVRCDERHLRIEPHRGQRRVRHRCVPLDRNENSLELDRSQRRGRDLRRLLSGGACARGRQHRRRTTNSASSYGTPFAARSGTTV